MKRLLSNSPHVVLFAIIFFSVTVHSQSTRPFCGTPNVGPQQMLKQRAELTEWLNKGNRVLTPTNYVYIPVAFHMVRKSDSTCGVTIAQLNNQIAVLNSSFVLSPYRFFTFSIDTANNSYWSTQESSRPPSQVEQDMKNALAIDPAHVLNFYTVSAISGYSGYARFPSDFSDTSKLHGVVLDYRVFPGGSATNFNLGKVGVHEVGHYMGLYHTFQNDCDGDGDYVPDTPFQSFGPWVYDCDDYDSCPGEGKFDGMDPIHNYMNYSDDNCRNEYTSGQVARMNEQMSMYRSSMFATATTVTQKWENGNEMTGTNVDRWEGASFTGYAVPFTFQQLNGTAYTLRGLQTVSSGQKYNRWYEIADVTNHKGFSVGDAQQSASLFKTSHNATLQAQVVDGGSPGGEIEFLDPWYIDTTDAYGDRNQGLNAWHRTVTFESNNIGVHSGQSVKFLRQGVFWNENPFFNPELPGYSVAALPTQTISGFASNFQGWVGTGVTIQNSANRTTGIVFSSESATVTANYKAHLASNSSSVLPTNGQRRFASFADALRHEILYESASEIWSSYGVESYSNEVRVSSGNGGNSAPCLATRYDDTKLHAVWRHDNGNGTYGIVYANRISGAWSTPATIATVSGVVPVPLITVKAVSGYSAVNAPVYIVYQEGSTTLRTKRSTDGGSSWSNDGGTLAIGTSNLSLSPLESHDVVPTTMTLCYQDENAISIRDFATSWGSAGTVPGSSSAGYWTEGEAEGYVFEYSTANNPQVLRYDGRTYVAWNQSQGYSTEQEPYFADVSHKVFKTRDQYGTWSNAVAILSFDNTQWLQDASAPALNVLQNNVIVMEWSLFGELKRGTFTLGGDPTLTDDSSGTDVQFSVSSGSPAYQTVEMHKETAGALYKLDHSSQFYQRVTPDGSQIPSLPLSYSRMMTIEDTSTGAFYSVSVTQPRIGEQRLAFAPVNDTLPGITAENFFSFLSTESIVSVNSNDTITFDVVTKARGWGKASQLLHLSASIAADLASEQVETDLGGDAKKISVRMPVGDNAGKALGLRITATLPNQSSGLQYSLTHIYSEEKQSKPPSLTKSVGKPQASGAPAEFGLGQNYPNPFNPVTTIPFLVENASFVRIAVYDLLGREIAMLQNGFVTAGPHNLQWKADGYPSGTYICRLTAVDGEGKSLTRSVRMQYVR